FLYAFIFCLILSFMCLTVLMLVLTLLLAESFADNKIWSYDKLGHLLLFGSWTFLLGLYHSITRTETTNFWVIFLIGASFGIVIEILQYSLPSLNRQADIFDVLFVSVWCLLAF